MLAYGNYFFRMLPTMAPVDESKHQPAAVVIGGGYAARGGREDVREEVDGDR